MDLIFSKYPSPFIFLDSLIQLNQVIEGLNHVIEADREAKLWELYLHSFPNVSFEKWKENVFKAKPKELNEIEITTQLNEATNILNSFHIERG